MMKARDLKIEDRLTKIDERTKKGKVDFKEVWKQVASQDLMYDTTQTPCALASVLQSVTSEGQLMTEVIAEIVEEGPLLQGCYRFTRGTNKIDPGWRKQVCDFIYKAVTDLEWEDRKKESNRSLWKKIRESGEPRLLKVYLGQVKNDFMEEAAFTKMERYQRAVTDVCKELGRETHPEVTTAMRRIRGLYDEHDDSQGRSGNRHPSWEFALIPGMSSSDPGKECHN